MRNFKQATQTVYMRAAMVICAAMISITAWAASPKLQTIDVTPAAKTISVGQTVAYKATGTFSDGSKQVLWPAISNIATGALHETCALLTSGGIECWGQNESGQLGDGNTADSLVPRPVTGINTATAITLGELTGCALLRSGAVKCWGWNVYGQLGNGSNADSNVPVSVTGITTATALGVSADARHNCVVLAGGAVQCWGSNAYGQLGDGTTTDSNTPVSVHGIGSATAVGVGGGNSCALLVSGAVQCWGDNETGELGNGTTTNSNTPVTVHGISSAKAIAVGDLTNCALLASGAVQCWGESPGGPPSTIPVTVPGLGSATAISAGGGHLCAALRSGSVQCWGYNFYGELGNGTRKSSDVPVPVKDILAPTKLAAGWQHTCALFSGGMMRCWGSNWFGELGNRLANIVATPSPVTVLGTPGVVWTSSNPTKGTINDRGIATGRAAGNTTITATTAGLINDNAVLTVK